MSEIFDSYINEYDLINLIKRVRESGLQCSNIFYTGHMTSPSYSYPKK